VLEPSGKPSRVGREQDSAKPGHAVSAGACATLGRVHPRSEQRSEERSSDEAPNNVRGSTMNVAGLLRRQAARHPERVALIDGDARLTWSDLDRRVERVARGLAGLGLVAGHRVGIALADGAEFITCYLATLRGGLVAVPVNPTSRPGEIGPVLADCGARVCFADLGCIDALRLAVSASDDVAPGGDVGYTSPWPPLVVVVGSAPRPGEIGYADLPPDETPVVAPLDPELLAALVYTSGTSGTPRAAMLSHRALLANIQQSSGTDPPPVRESDIVLGVLPMCHAYALNAVLGQVLLTGATLVLGTRLTADAMLELIRRERVSCVPVAPAVIAAWLERPDAPELLASVGLLLSAAAPLPEETVRAFEARTGITVEQGYGLTEAGPAVTSTIGTPTHKPGSVGRALPGVALRVVDEAGADVRGDDAGEILVRGCNLFSGYWPDGEESPGDGAWLHTGDIGFLDADDDLFIVDRVKELVIVSGFNVYPSEIEDVIAEVAGVRECAVIGVPHEATGEAVVAYVVALPEAVAGLETAVAAHCADRLARFKVPWRIEVVERLPHAANGKVAKGRLRLAGARREPDPS
jgi:long-chain acyl-CoA synthetase